MTWLCSGRHCAPVPTVVRETQATLSRSFYGCGELLSPCSRSCVQLTVGSGPGARAVCPCPPLAVPRLWTLMLSTHLGTLRPVSLPPAPPLRIWQSAGRRPTVLRLGSRFFTCCLGTESCVASSSASLVFLPCQGCCRALFTVSARLPASRAPSRLPRLRRQPRPQPAALPASLGVLPQSLGVVCRRLSIVVNVLSCVHPPAPRRGSDGDGFVVGEVLVTA